MRGALCGKLHRPPSQLLFAQQQSSINIQLFVQNRDLCLPHLHLMPPLEGVGPRRNISRFSMDKLATTTKNIALMIFSQPSIYIDGWLYGMSITSVVCNVPVLSQNDSTYHHSVFTT